MGMANLHDKIRVRLIRIGLARGHGSVFIIGQSHARRFRPPILGESPALQQSLRVSVGIVSSLKYRNGVRNEGAGGRAEMIHNRYTIVPAPLGIEH